MPDLLPPTAAPAVTADPWQTLRRHTPARIGLGRVGVSQPSNALLAFGAAHAQARDAVHLPLDIEALVQRLHTLPVHEDSGSVIHVHSAAPDRATYLLRPDLGRRLDEASRHTLAGMAQAAGAAKAGRRVSGTTPGTRSGLAHSAADPGAAPDSPVGGDLLLVIGDGLSAAAIERQAVPFIERVLARQPAGWRLGPLVIASQARVALGDEIGQLLGARVVAMLIGERPGLSSPDSLGVYLTHAPHVGRTDAERNCLSNIRPEGLTHDDAARKLWWLATQARQLGCTGVGLKDRSDALPVQDASASAAQLPDGE